MNERDIFLAALEITDPEARRNYLDQACGGNMALRASVEALFLSHDGAGDFLKTPLVQPTGSDFASAAAVEVPSAAMDRTAHLSQEHQDLNSEDDDTAEGFEIPFGFLSPSTKPNSLGRLGHYEVLELLGKGAFGTVLRAFDEKLHRMVAIKVMSAVLASTSPARKRFLREARSAAAIRHDNVVAIHAVEEEPIPYLVMEYIPGRTLQQFLDEHGPLDLTDTLRLSQQMASGLAAAHAQGLIHRDIKPSNILLEDGIQQKVKISDFGLARAADDASLTQSGTIAGTPMYMSPEQAHSHHIDQRSDLFSFGSVLYQMVSGRPPFRASSTLAVLKRVTEDTPRPIQEIIPEVPDWLCTIISKLHSKQPADRYQTANEVADLLARCQSELQQFRKVTCVQSSPHALREESRATKDVNPPNDILRPTTSTARSANFTQSVKATLNRPRLIAASIISTVAIIAILMLNRFNNSIDTEGGERQPSGTQTETSNSKFQISNADPSWHGWPTDAPSPAIASFNAEEAKQHQEAWAKYLKIDVEYTNSIGMKFRLIPPGEFWFGASEEESGAALRQAHPDYQKVHKANFNSESPRHRVALTKPIYMGIFEVRQKDFERIMKRNPSYFSPTGPEPSRIVGLNCELLPVENVSWNDAAEFCAKLSQFEQLDPKYAIDGDVVTLCQGDGYEMPTEFQWEFSCRAGTETRFSSGDSEQDLGKVGWSYGSAGQNMHTVGQLAANAFGLYDMHGNATEWTGSRFEDARTGWQAATAVDPTGPELRDQSISTRSGNWDFSPAFCRSASRAPGAPYARNYKTGFRVSLPADAVQKLRGVTTVAPKTHATEFTGNDIEHAVNDATSMVESAPSADPDRRAAEYVLSIGGSISIKLNGVDQPISAVAELSNAPFELSSVNLSYNTRVSDAGLSSFRNCKNLAFVGLSSAPLGDFGLRNIGDCDNLTQLWLNDTQVTDAGLAHLNEFEYLRALGLSGTSASDAGLVNLQNCRNLKTLELKNTRISLRGQEQLKTTLPMCQITWSEPNRSVAENVLALGGAVEIGTPGQVDSHPVQTIADLPAEFFQVRRVSLAGVTKPLDMLPTQLALLHFPAFDHLESLNLSGIEWMDYGILAQIQGLQELNLSNSGLIDDILAQLPKFPLLKHLVLDGNDIRGTGLKALKAQPELIDLSLGCPRLGDLLASNLAELKQINRLSLAGSGLSDVGIKHLASLTNLESLDLRRTKVTASGIAELQLALPKCQIASDFSDVAGSEAGK